MMQKQRVDKEATPHFGNADEKNRQLSPRPKKQTVESIGKQGSQQRENEAATKGT